MKTKILCLASLLLFLMSCNQNQPSAPQGNKDVEIVDNNTPNDVTSPSEGEDHSTPGGETKQYDEEYPAEEQSLNNPIWGIWNEPATEYLDITSLLFAENGVLVYRHTADGLKLNQTAGSFYQMVYTVEDNSLNIGDRQAFYHGSFITIPGYSTSYSIENDVLSVSNFKIEPDYSASLTLKKAEKIEKVSLDDNSKKALGKIFSHSNELVNGLNGSCVKIFASMSELKAICPEDVNLPNIDFSKQCVIAAACQNTESLTWHADLYRNQEVDLYEFVVSAKSDSDNLVYAYGVYSIPAATISKIKHMAQLVK